MRQLCLYIIILYGLLLLSGCRDSLELPENVPLPEAERTAIIYMAADNSLWKAAQADTTEMSSGGSQMPEGTNVIVYLDDKKLPAIYELTRSNGLRLWKQFREELCSTDGPTMLSVLQEIVHNFPARSYGLTLWSHATGWEPRRATFGKDEKYSDPAEKNEMEIPVLRDVLAQMPHLDYIFFDACFMGSIEAAYELRHAADRIIASPAEIPGSGAPYDKIIGPLCRADAEGLIAAYDGSYPGTYGGYYYSGVLLSCIDCGKLDALAEATAPLLTPFYMGHSEPSTEGFQKYSESPYKYTYQFDMRTTMRRLLDDEKYQRWMEAFDAAVPLRTLSDTHTWFATTTSDKEVHDPTCYGGVTMFVPTRDYEPYGWNEDFRQTAWYAATGWQATGW